MTSIFDILTIKTAYNIITVLCLRMSKIQKRICRVSKIGNLKKKFYSNFAECFLTISYLYNDIIIKKTLKTYISHLVHMARFCINRQQVCSTSKEWKAK